MIRILGAGISGLTAAINLAKNKKEVTIYEKYHKVGMKIKPNLQLLGNWDTKEDIISYLKGFNIKINYQKKIERIVFYSSDLKTIGEIFADERPVGYTVKRGGKDSFECYLAKQAKKEGVKIVTNFKKKIKPDIIATGSKKLDAIGYGGVFKGRFNEKTATILFDYNYAPCGYAYLLPHSKKIATVAIAMRPWGNPNNLFQKLIHEHRLFKDKLHDSTLLYNFSGFANFSIPKTAIINDSLLVGESAGFQDYAFGFGMRYAIYSGFLAAKAIVEDKNYNDLWKRAFLYELRKTNRIRYVLDRTDNSFLNQLIRNIGKEVLESLLTSGNLIEKWH